MTKYILASYCERHIQPESNTKTLNKLCAEIIKNYEEQSAREQSQHEYRMWKELKESDAESSDAYESEGDGFCPYCSERPCACSERDN